MRNPFPKIFSGRKKFVFIGVALTLGIALVVGGKWYLLNNSISLPNAIYRAGDRTYNVLNLTATVQNRGLRPIRVTSEDIYIISSNGQVAEPVVWFDDYVQPFSSKNFELQFNLFSGDYPDTLLIRDPDLKDDYQKRLVAVADYFVIGQLRTKADLMLAPSITVVPTTLPTPSVQVPVTKTPDKTSDYEKDIAEMTQKINEFTANPASKGVKVELPNLGLSAMLPASNSYYYHETQPKGHNEEGPGYYSMSKDCFKLGADKLTPGNEEIYCRNYEISYKFFSDDRLQSYSEYMEMFIDSYPQSFTSLLGDDTKFSQESLDKFGQKVTLKYFQNDSRLYILCSIILPNGHTVVMTAEMGTRSDNGDQNYSKEIIKAIIRGLEIK